MKLFSIHIINLYFRTQSSYLVTDFDVSDNDVKTEISQAMDNDHQHQDSDLCSPFCICQCCHINATYLQFSYIKYEITFISTQDFFYHNGIEKDFTTSILQPPRA